jgi:hypothetical protein
LKTTEPSLVVVEVVVEVVDQPEAKVAVVLVLFRVMAAITEHPLRVAQD